MRGLIPLLIYTVAGPYILRLRGDSYLPYSSDFSTVRVQYETRVRYNYCRERFLLSIGWEGLKRTK